MLSQISNKFNSLRWKLSDSLKARRMVHSRGLRFSLACDNFITNYRWSTFNTKEPETLDWIDQSLTSTDTLFDIGANIGIYSLYAALRHPGLRVICFEPEYSNLHLLRDNVAANNLQDVIEIYGLGLSSVTGLSHLYVQDFTPGAALHSESTAPLQQTLNGKPVVFREGIWAMKLDDFVQASNRFPTVLKIDVDGTEAEILEGAVKTIGGSSVRSILVELDSIGNKDQRAREILSKAGLQIVFKKPVHQCQVEIWERAVKAEMKNA
ncbi:MAG: hypothetical protein KCHDKBKB_01099 [Elusimicrobia bacterium]|nr:hypothetical protein [Elusimicrobiota bacterium]